MLEGSIVTVIEMILWLQVVTEEEKKSCAFERLLDQISVLTEDAWFVALRLVTVV